MNHKSVTHVCFFAILKCTNAIYISHLFFQVVVTEVMGGGKFYVQTVADQRVAAIQQQLASLKIHEAPVVGAFNPAKGDIVLAQFTYDNSWNRAMVIYKNFLLQKVHTENYLLLIYYNRLSERNSLYRSIKCSHAIDPIWGLHTGLCLVYNLISCKSSWLISEHHQSACINITNIFLGLFFEQLLVLLYLLAVANNFLF